MGNDWRLQSARYGDLKVNVSRLYEEAAVSADQRRRSIRAEKELAEAFELRKDHMLDLLRTAKRTELRKVASEVTLRTVVNGVVDFYANLVDIKITETPWKQEANGITWSLPYVAHYHRGGKRIKVTGTLNTFWRLEGTTLALVDLSPKVENETSDGTAPAVDSEHILRYAFDARFTDVPARLVFDYLESDRMCSLSTAGWERRSWP